MFGACGFSGGDWKQALEPCTPSFCHVYIDGASSHLRQMRSSLNSLRGDYAGDSIGDYYRGY